MWNAVINLECAALKVPFYVTLPCFQSGLTFFGSQISYTVCLKDSSTQKIERESISVKYTQLSGTTQEEEHMKAAEEKKKKKKPDIFPWLTKLHILSALCKIPWAKHDLHNHKSSKSRWKF